MPHADRRNALYAALVTALLYGALTLTLFPARLQFSKYPRAAEQYLAGTLPAERLLDFSPFYFYLHVLQAALLSGEVVVFVQILVAAATAAMLFLLLRTSFATWIAATLTTAFVLSRSVMVYTAILEPELFLLLFLICFLFFALRSGIRSALYAGLALALSLSIRPSVLPMLLVVPVHYLFKEGHGRWLRSSALALAPSLVLLLALGLRNGMATGEYSPLGMNPGFVFFEGNNPLSSGRSSVYPPIVGELKQEIVEHPDNPHLTYRLIAARVSGRELSTAEANRYWRSRAVAYITDHPTRFLARVATKAHATLQSYRRHDLVPAQRYDERLRWVPGFPFALLMAAALTGLVLSRGDWRRQLLVYALLGSQLLLMLLMYVSERQRLAALPSLAFFAGAALAHLAAARGRRRLAIAAALGVLALLLLLPTHLTREDRHFWAAFLTSARSRELAVSLRNERRLGEARAMAALSYAAAPWLKDYARPAGVGFGPEGIEGAALALLGPVGRHPSLRFDRAQLLLAAGKLEEAARLLESLSEEGRRFDRGYYQSSEPKYWRARVEAAGGRTASAVNLLLEALERAPGDPFVLAELSALTGDPAYHERIVRYFGEADADFLVGVARLENGVPGAAVSLASTVERLPELWRAQIYLAAALGAEGESERGAQLYQQAITGRSDPALLEERILPVLAAATEARPGDARAGYRYGLALAQYGRFEEALAALRAARSAAPSREIDEAMAEIERLRAGVR